MSSGAAAAASRRGEPNPVNPSTILLYPFHSMNLGWWDSFLGSVSPLNRVSVLVHVIQSLMTDAVLHEDPFLEEAVLHMGKALPAAWPPASLQEDGDVIPTFEAAYHVFQTICVLSKFRTLDAPAKHGLLAMAEQRIQLIVKGTQPQPDKPAAAHALPTEGRTSFWAAAQVAIERMQSLQKELDSRVAWGKLLHAMKVLFFSVNLKHGKLVAGLDPAVNPLDNFACYQGCPCYTRLRATHTLFLRGMEKIKILDCAMIASVKEDDILLREVATELLYRYRDHLAEDPPANDLVRQIQNGTFFYCRLALFRALGCLQDLAELHSDSVTAGREFASALHRYIVCMVWVKNEVRRLKGVKDLVPMIHRALVAAEAAFRWSHEGGFRQLLHTLKGHTTGCFVTLAAAKYHFAVHSRDVFVGKPVEMRCANPKCPCAVRELLKCSGCDVTYYCSADCQRADWETHKVFCHEMESRRARPEPIPHVRGPMQCIKPKV